MKLTTLCLCVLLFVSCNTNKKQKNETVARPIPTKTTAHPGKKLMKVYCYQCHDATTPEKNRLGPPMIAIKRHYITTKTTKAQFIADMQNWIKNPTEDNAKMHAAVARFGVMSKMVYPESVIKKIADYMYDNALDAPEWFEAHYQKNMKSNKHK
ncbi:hypothetical protein [Jejuia pallidilutea]|uniref:hypothetical protein n=2 Tax=Jejuia pallidilutea TaxID=504487 RepID=UPI001269FEB1|nr:hypothetical protein [Jejuia pallidilutea]